MREAKRQSRRSTRICRYATRIGDESRHGLLLREAELRCLQNHDSHNAGGVRRDEARQRIFVLEEP